METQDMEELKQDMIGQGKMKVHQYWKQRDGSAIWSIWDKLNPQNGSHIEMIMKEIEKKLGKRKIGVSEEDDQLR
jgi:hypothetical protein